MLSETIILRYSHNDNYQKEKISKVKIISKREIDKEKQQNEKKYSDTFLRLLYTKTPIFGIGINRANDTSQTSPGAAYYSS